MSTCAWIKCLHIGRRKNNVEYLVNSDPFYRYSCPQGWLQHKIPNVLSSARFITLHTVLCSKQSCQIDVYTTWLHLHSDTVCCYWYVFTYFVAYLHGHMHIAAGICVLACLIYFLSFCLFCLFIYFFVYLLFVILRWYFLIVHIMYNTAIALIKYKYYGIDRCPT